MATENLGGIEVELGANIKTLISAVSAIERLTKSIDKLASKADNMASSASKSFQKVGDSATKSANKRISAAEKETQKEINLVKHMLKVGHEKIKQEENATKHIIAIGRQKLAAEERLESNSVKHIIKAGRQKLAAEERINNERIKQAQRVNKAITRDMAGLSSTGQPRFQSATSQGATYSALAESLKQQEKAQNGVSKSSTKMNKRMKETAVSLHDLSSTAVLSFGPLSGVGSRIIALTSIFNRNVVALSAIIVSMTAFTALLVKSVSTASKYEAQVGKLSNVLRATGNEAGYTVGELDSLAVKLGEQTLTSASAAREAEALLLSFKGLNKDGFEEALFLAQDLSATFGGNLRDNARKLGQVFENPIRGMDGLSRASIRFSNQEKDVIRQLVATGKAAEATNRVLEKVRRVQGNAASEAGGLAGSVDTLGEKFTRFLEVTGSSEAVIGSLTNIVKKLTEQVQKLIENEELVNKISRMFGKIIDFLGEVVINFSKNLEILISLFAGFIASRIILSGVNAFTALTAATGATSKAIAVLSAVIKTNPLARFLTLVASAATYFGVFYSDIDKATDGQERFNKSVKDGEEAIKKNSRAMVQQNILKEKDKIAEYRKQIDRLKNKIVDFQKRSPAGQQALLGNLPQQIEQSKKRIAELERDLKNISASEQSSEINRLKLQFEELSSTVSDVKLAGAQKEFDKFSAKVKALETTLGSLTDEQVRQLEELIGPLDKYREALDVLKVKVERGAFYELNKQVKELDIALEQSRGKFVAFTNEGVSSLQKLSNKFDEVNTKSKWINEIENWTPKAREAAAGFLGTSSSVEDLANAYTYLETQTKIVNNDLSVSQQVLGGLREEIEAVNQLTTMQRVGGFFSSSVVDNAVKINKEFIKTKTLLSQMSPEGLSEVAFTIEGMALDQGIDLGENFNPTNIDQLTAALEKLKGKTKETETSWSQIGSVFSNVLGQMVSMTTQITNMHAEWAAFHHQAAMEALEYGRTTSEMYQQLADQTRYSNNEQAQAFEDRAIAAAEAGAREYQAQKKAQEQANALAKKAFENQKQMQIAQAMMSTATAVVQTWNNLGGWPLGAIGAAAMAAIGAAQIATIQSQQYVPREKGGPVIGGKTYLVGEAGPEIITPRSSGTVIPNKDLGGMSGGGEDHIHFHMNDINDNDFRQKLMANRGLIINMYREAKNRNMENF